MKCKSEAVSEFIFKQNEKQEELFYLRALVLGQTPDVKESIKWNIPFYDYLSKPLLYFNPKKDKIIIGFMNRFTFNDEMKLFAPESFSLKQVRHIYFSFEWFESEEAIKNFEKQFSEIMWQAINLIERP